MTRRSKQGRIWQPVAGQLARYVGDSSVLLRGGGVVRILAEARGRRTVVEGIGHAGRPVSFTVATANLAAPLPDLFAESPPA